MIGALRPIFALWAQIYYGWALREIDPLHPDVAEIAIAHADAVRRVDGSPAAVRLKTALAPVIRSVRRAAAAFWRWC
jgi:hypothetical protein